MSTRRFVVAIAAIVLLSSSAVYANSLQVNAAAAMTGSFGLAVTIEPGNTGNSVYVEKTGWDESNILARWQWRHESLIADDIDSRSFQLLALLGFSDGGPTPGALQILGRAYLSGKGTQVGQPPAAFFRAHAMCRNSNNSARFSSTLTIPKSLASTTSNEIITWEYELIESTGTNFDGVCCVRVIGVGERCRTDAQTYLNHITGARFGAIGTGNVPSAADGTYHLDTFEAFR